MLTRERSAGVIVYKRDDANRPLFLLLDYGKHWDFAKGHVERGEDDRAAALRELHEETGISQIELHPHFAKQIIYFFRSKRGLIRKQVIFYLGETSETEVKLSDEHVGFAYLPMEDALKRLTFPTARQALRDAAETLNA